MKKENSENWESDLDLEDFIYSEMDGLLDKFDDDELEEEEEFQEDEEEAEEIDDLDDFEFAE